MNFGVFDYAGPTLLAYVAFWTSISVATMFVVCWGWWLYRAFKSDVKSAKIKSVTIPLVVVFLYVAAAWFFGPLIDKSWTFLKENPRRTYGSYVGLTWVSAFMPSIGDRGVNAFIHLASRDSGFAKGTAVRVETVGGHEIATYSDEDYAGDVVTLDGRPVITGKRFEATRILTALIPYFEMPTAKSVKIVGGESFVYSPHLQKAGLSVDVSDNVLSRGTDVSDGCDIVLVTPQPDWIANSDMPNAAMWKKLSQSLSTNGIAALHIDARLLSLARLKGILADFRKVFEHYHFWCVGRYDYVVTSSKMVKADSVLDLFADQKAFEVFAGAGIFSPADVFACAVGTDYEVEPALLKMPSFSHLKAGWNAPRLAFEPLPTNYLTSVDASLITPYYIPPMDWFVKGDVDGEVFVSMTNRIKDIQAMRREIIVGFSLANSGGVTNALDKWSSAAKVNMNDPLLSNLADSMDIEGRRYLRIGNMNGAIRCYENRLLIRPKDVAAIHNFGVCLKRCGHPEMAVRVFAQAVNLDPHTDEHRMEMIETAAASKHEDVAVRQLEVLMKKYPNDPRFMMRAAKLLCVKENPLRNETKAIQLAEKAVELTAWKERSMVLGLADVYISAGRVMMGMGLKKKMRTMKFDR